jgi:glycosyltransferase involved in cell wall biosynthesis
MAYYFRTFIEENFIVKKYDQFVVLTEEDKSSWQPKVKNVIAIPNIIPFENVNQSVLQNKQVIAVGRLDAQKGFDKLIHIWKQIADMFPDWKLTIYGSGIDEDFLNALISKYKLCEYIQILPPTQNILEKYRESSVFVMTSRYEGMPMTMLEAMSVGLPCVSYNFKCGPKDIITDNVDGYIVDEDDDIKFTECLTELFTNENKRLQMGNAAYLNMMRYTKDNIMKIWVDLFTTILEK